MKRRVFASIALLPPLSACVGLNINGVELSPVGIGTAIVGGIARSAVRETRSTLASGRAQRLSQGLKDSNISKGAAISDDLVKLIQADYQALLDQVVARITAIQRASPIDSPLRVKGEMRKIQLAIDNQVGGQINAWSRDDILQPTITIPTGFIVRSLLRLQAEQEQTKREAKDIFSRAFVGFTSYVPFLEFEELMRFIIAHEATHIWLHTAALPIREREIEADAWGVAISSSLSEVFEFRAKSGRMAMTGGFSTSDPFDMALMSTRFGFEVLDYLYGDSGVLSQSADRETLAERRKSTEEKYSQVFSQYLSKLKDSDIALFAVMRNILK